MATNNRRWRAFATWLLVSLVVVAGVGSCVTSMQASVDRKKAAVVGEFEILDHFNTYDNDRYNSGRYVRHKASGVCFVILDRGHGLAMTEIDCQTINTTTNKDKNET